MRGGQIHEFIISNLAAAFRNLGFRVTRQFPVRVANTVRYVDLFATNETEKIAVEVEMSGKRILNDWQKADELGAVLWIVVPHPRLRTAIQRRFERAGVKTESVFVLTYGQAIQAVTNKYAFSSLSMLGRKRKEIS